MATDLSDLFPNYSSGYAGPQESAFDWISSFANSGLQSIPEMVGITPSATVQQWRADHPVSGFLSEMAGMAVPYTGWLKVAGRVPQLMKAVNAIGDLNKNPVLTGALREMATLAPFEAGRVAASQVVGDQPLSDMVSSGIMNTALAGGVGGLLHGMAGAGVRDPGLKTLFPDLDIAAPLPLQARQMQGLLDGGTLQGEAKDRAVGKLNETLRLARTEELPQGQKYIAPLEDRHGGIDQQLNRLFRVRETPDDRVLQVRKFAQGVEKDYPTAQAWQDEASAAGLPPGFETAGQ